MSISALALCRCSRCVSSPAHALSGQAFIPILTLVIQLLFRLTGAFACVHIGVTDPAEYNHLLLGIIILTCSGSVIAAAGEIRFSVFGFICQIAAVIVSLLYRPCSCVQVESARLVMIQILLRDLKLDPLSSIAMYAPVRIVHLRADLY